LATLGTTHSFLEEATLKELRRHSQPAKAVATPSELRKSPADLLNPGFQSKPWAGISERFQRLLREAVLNGEQ
jgi:hypothetical protein